MYTTALGLALGGGVGQASCVYLCRPAGTSLTLRAPFVPSSLLSAFRAKTKEFSPSPWASNVKRAKNATAR